MDFIYTSTLSNFWLIAAYIFAGTMVLRLFAASTFRTNGFCLVNIAAFYLLFFHNGMNIENLSVAFAKFGIYVLFAALHWYVINHYSNRDRNGDAFYFAALLYPILPLIVVKFETNWHLIGFSYMSFRMALTAMELRKHKKLGISLPDYLGFSVLSFDHSSWPH